VVLLPTRDDVLEVPLAVIGRVNANELPWSSETEKAPEEDREKLCLMLLPWGWPMKRRAGIDRVVFQLERGSRGWEEDEGGGQVRVWFQVLRAVTVPGGRGVPAGWLGGAAAAGARGTRNRKFGNNRRGISTAEAGFFVIPAAICCVLSYLNNHLACSRSREEVSGDCN
jgi:hypothetical protein